MPRSSQIYGSIGLGGGRPETPRSVRSKGAAFRLTSVKSPCGPVMCSAAGACPPGPPSSGAAKCAMPSASVVAVARIALSAAMSATLPPATGVAVVKWRNCTVSPSAPRQVMGAMLVRSTSCTRSSWPYWLGVPSSGASDTAYSPGFCITSASGSTVCISRVAPEVRYRGGAGEDDRARSGRSARCCCPGSAADDRRGSRADCALRHGRSGPSTWRY